MDWVDTLQGLRRKRIPAVVVTLAVVRGHAPRESGAKMVVSPDEVYGTVGGGNLEATAIARARGMLASGVAEPELVALTLSDKATTEFGVQCCGGEVTMMLEPIPVVPVVAVFGVGHVGWELARILARHDLELYLIDSREAMLDADRIGHPGRSGVFADAVAHVHVVPSPVPEVALASLPAGAHVLVMTHDHIEDLAVVDQALRTDGIRSIGLIGSTAKWTRFRAELGAHGHADDDLARVSTPIGIPEVTGKHPAVIAVSVAARILQLIDEDAAPLTGPETPPRHRRDPTR